MPFEICLITTNVCQLNCNFCGRNEIDPEMQKLLDKDIMSVERVGEILDRVDMSAVDSVSLTPVIGDFFLHPQAFEILDLLESRDDVKEVTMTTNLLALNSTRISRLLGYKKLALTISMYGGTRESYKEFTNRDMFNKFVENFSLMCTLYIAAQSNMKVVFGLRVHPKELMKSNIIYTSMKMWMNYSKKVRMGELEDDHHNFCSATKKDGTLPVIEDRKGVCWYLMEGPAIYPDGAICYCPTDIFKDTWMGNVFNMSWEEIMDARGHYARVKAYHKRGTYIDLCKDCSTWKHPDYTPTPWTGDF
jgi:MoaA/NifB/PqqE/SkfB family radical SAM enzyme